LSLRRGRLRERSYLFDSEAMISAKLLREDSVQDEITKTRFKCLEGDFCESVSVTSAGEPHPVQIVGELHSFQDRQDSARTIRLRKKKRSD
jgi:hypothetical protein